MVIKTMLGFAVAIVLLVIAGGYVSLAIDYLKDDVSLGILLMLTAVVWGLFGVAFMIATIGSVMA